MSFNDLKSQYLVLENRINTRIKSVLEHGQYIMGPEVIELEQTLSNYTNVKHVKTCANGTDAIMLALMALGVKEGDAVFCPTFTFFATAEAISILGATPIFVDCEINGFNICPVDLVRKIKTTTEATSLKPKIILSVDLFGLPANYPEIKKVAMDYKLKIVEDAAQGFGGKIGDDFATSFGDIATTSFFPSKPLGCYGDGGAVFTNSDELATIIESLRVHGKGQNKYDNVRIGMNSRLDTIQAAILLEKITILEDEIEARQELAEYYNHTLAGRCVTPVIPNNFRSSWAQYTIITDERTDSINYFNELGIPTAIYYPKCIHEQPVYSKTTDTCVRAEFLSKRCLSLPMNIYTEKYRFD